MAVEESMPSLKRATALAVVSFLAFAFYKAGSGNVTGALCAIAVMSASLLPGILWVTGQAKGFPIFPLFAFTYSYSYGIQFLVNDIVLKYAKPDELVSAAVALTLFLLFGTAVWFPFVARPRPAAQSIARVLQGRRAVRVLLFLTFLFAAFVISDTAGWLASLWRYQSIMRALLFSFGLLSTFALCFFLGQGRLTKNQRNLFLLMLIPAMMAVSSGLLLIQTLGIWFLATTGFVLGSRRVPWKVTLVVLPLFLVLHYGKYEMRDTYWRGEDGQVIHGLKPWEYPTFYLEWLEKAVDPTEKFAAVADDRPELLQRSSLLQLFLLLQQISPQQIPFMNGATYRLIPGLILPRILVPQKMTTTLANAQISIHYGLQTEESALDTSVGWGLFNEAYANFGYVGLAGLAIFTAAFFGLITRYAMGYPVLSFRGLLAITVMNVALQNEFSSPHFVTVLFQSTIALITLSFVIMRRERIVPDIHPMSVREFVETVAPKALARRLLRRRASRKIRS